MEKSLTFGLDTRALVLTFVEDELVKLDAPGGTWNPGPIREKLDEGIKAIDQAQLLVTSFQWKLEKLRKRKA